MCITMILRGRIDKMLVLIAACCSSWVCASRGSTGRSFLTPLGRQELPSVALANLLACRIRFSNNSSMVPNWITHFWFTKSYRALTSRTLSQQNSTNKNNPEGGSGHHAFSGLWSRVFAGAASLEPAHGARPLAGIGPEVVWDFKRAVAKHLVCGLYVLPVPVNCLNGTYGSQVSCGAAKVWKQNFWMMHWGSASPKRTSLWSNSLEIRRFNKGRLSREQMKKTVIKTSKRYRDSSGKERWCGGKDLKKTQTLSFIGHRVKQDNVD